MKGELKLMENVMAFLVIIIIGMIALIYFATAQGSEQQRESEERVTHEALRTARSLYNMPELSCTFSETGRCIDLAKARAFAEHMSDHPQDAAIYLSSLGRSRISIRCLDCTDAVIVHDLLDSPDYRQVQVPVLVYNATSSTRSFGWLEVRV